MLFFLFSILLDAAGHVTLTGETCLLDILEFLLRYRNAFESHHFGLLEKTKSVLQGNLRLDS